MCQLKPEIMGQFLWPKTGIMGERYLRYLQTILKLKAQENGADQIYEPGRWYTTCERTPIICTVTANLPQNVHSKLKSDCTD
jgi:hypothetical protein